MVQRILFHGRSLQHTAVTTHGLVGLGDHGHHLIAIGD